MAQKRSSCVKICLSIKKTQIPPNHSDMCLYDHVLNSQTAKGIPNIAKTEKSEASCCCVQALLKSPLAGLLLRNREHPPSQGHDTPHLQCVKTHVTKSKNSTKMGLQTSNEVVTSPSGPG